MKRKETLFLMELLIMIAVFAVSAGVCLRIFSASVERSRESAALDRSVIEAQNVAEYLLHTGGDMAAGAKFFGGTPTDDPEASADGVRFTIYYDESWQILPQKDGADCVYYLTAAVCESDSPYLGKGQVTVYAADGAEIFALPVAWQTGGDGDGT